MRLRRICSKEEWFEAAVKELEERLRVRGYIKEVVMAGIEKARKVPRVEALKRVEKNEGNNEKRTG